MKIFVTRVVLFLLTICSRRCSCGYFDYTDFEDPFQILWNTKNQVAPDPNSPCLGSIGNIAVEGVCKSRTECQLTGGTSAGFCGLLSTCCVYAGSCGNKFSSKISYFTSINTPRSQTCNYQVKLHNKNVCQLRLDILNMSLAPPATNEPYRGSCRDEKFFVEGYPDIPKICGKNSGQHMYIPVNGNDSNPITLHVDVLNAPNILRSWTIKVTQLQCPGISVFPYRTQIEAMTRDFPLLAPQNCLQYFTDMQGSFQSFGYDLLNPNASSYNVNETYAICFKRHPGVCGISYIVDYFNLGTSEASTSGSTTSTTGSDYLYIPALRYSDSVQDEMIRGQQEQNKYFTSVTPGPFYAFFRSDSNKNDTSAELGFNIKYEVSTSCP